MALDDLPRPSRRGIRSRRAVSPLTSVGQDTAERLTRGQSADPALRNPLHLPVSADAAQAAD